MTSPDPTRCNLCGRILPTLYAARIHAAEVHPGQWGCGVSEELTEAVADALCFITGGSCAIHGYTTTKAHCEQGLRDAESAVTAAAPIIRRQVAEEIAQAIEAVDPVEWALRSRRRRPRPPGR